MFQKQSKKEYEAPKRFFALVLVLVWPSHPNEAKLFPQKQPKRKKGRNRQRLVLNIVLSYLKNCLQISIPFFSFFLKWLADFLGKQFTSGLSLFLSLSPSLLYLSIQLRSQEIGLLNFQKVFFFSPTTFFRLKRTLHLTHGTLRAKQICCFFLNFQIVFELLFSFILTFKQNVLQHFYIFVQKQIFFGLSFGSNNFLTFLTRL